MIKLALSDMDNTLLPFGRTAISPATKAAIHTCQEAGVDFGPASGRNQAELASFFEGDKSCYNTGVMINGQKVYYLGEVVFEKTLPREQLERVERIVGTWKAGACAFITYRDDGFADWIGASQSDLADMYERAFVHGGQHHLTLPDYPVIKAGIIVMDQRQAGDLSQQLTNACPDLVFPNTVDRWLDVTPKGWGKAHGVAILQKILGLQDKEICVFGDADNDLDMLRRYPNSCAVANANKNAAAAARWHIGASAEDGVAKALQDIAYAAQQSQRTGADTLPTFMQAISS
ncbi:MAG: HAD family hydrolase [Atopobiaceae bacterium]|jgi:Cof subfamily protein (haloacid dehalogenase superfamily)